MTEPKEYFDWNDAWVFMSLSNYVEEFKPVDLASIIGFGDMLNHAIISPDELRNGFKKLSTKGLIEIRGNELRLTSQGIEVRSKVKGGHFSRVDNCLKRINSKRLKLETIEQEDVPFDFLSDKAIQEGYRKYKSLAGNF